MPKLNINFDETPDTIPPIPEGVYLAEIQGPPKVEISKKGTSNNVIVDMVLVHDEKTINGRSVRHYINMGTNPELKMRSEVTLKQLCKSAGVAAGKDGVDTEELAGKRVKVHVKPRIYKDEAGNEQQGTEVVEYVAAGQ